MNLVKSKQRRWIKRVGKPRHPLATAKIGAVICHQRMKGVESVRGDVGIEVIVQTLIHRATIKIIITQGQKGERKVPLEKRVAAAEDTQSTINVEAETLPADFLVTAVRENVQRARERNGDEGTKELCFFKTPILIIGKIHNRTSNWKCS